MYVCIYCFFCSENIMYYPEGHIIYDKIVVVCSNSIYTSQKLTIILLTSHNSDCIFVWSSWFELRIKGAHPGSACRMPWNLLRTWRILSWVSLPLRNWSRRLKKQQQQQQQHLLLHLKYFRTPKYDLHWKLRYYLSCVFEERSHEEVIEDIILSS